MEPTELETWTMEKALRRSLSGSTPKAPPRWPYVWVSAELHRSHNDYIWNCETSLKIATREEVQARGGNLLGKECDRLNAEYWEGKE